MFSTRAFSFLFFVYCVLCAGVAVAQTQQQADNERLLEQEVRQRTPAELQPQPKVYKGFFYLPELTIIGTYNDNIFADNNNEVSDYILQAKPRLRIRKSYDAHEFNFDFQGDIRRHAKVENENTENFKSEIAGRFGLNKSLDIPFQLFMQRDVIGRATPGDSQFTDHPIRVFRQNVQTGISYLFNRLRLSVLGNIGRTTFEDDVSRTTNTRLVFKDQNRTRYGGLLSAEYEILGNNAEEPEHVLFANLSYQKQEFDNIADENGLVTASQRHNTEIGTLIGLKTQYKGLLNGKIGIGYFDRNYNNNDDVSQFDFEADLALNVMPKFTITVSGGREVNQDNSFVEGYIETKTGVDLDYELQHNFYLGAQFDYQNKDFLNNALNREDDTYGYGARLRYLHSPHFESVISVRRTTQNSSAAASEYDQNLILYSLTGRL